MILVATNLSDLDRLMPVAFAQARETGSRLILLHTVSSTETLTADAAGMPYYDLCGAIERAEDMLFPWRQQAESLGIKCHSMVRQGRAVDQILMVARQFRADRLLLGTRSRSRLTKLLLGSVAEEVLRSVNLPVVTVGPEAHLLVDGVTARVVLHATTLGETSRPSAALAYTIAAGQNAKLALLHVLPPAEGMPSHGQPICLDSLVLGELRHLAASIGMEGQVQIESVIGHGDPAIEILAQASERHASLIVLGAVRSSSLARITRDHIIYRVLAHARCPVLTLSEPMHPIAQDVSDRAQILHR
jgi:nucleotide-binding universal stress UspA family protein